jgi:uncharacterized membrane protein YeaQ/YmgE (transglycosylase-associated protein family)
MLNRFPDNARPLFAPAPASLAILLLAAVPALAGGYGLGSSHTFPDSIVEWIGFIDLDDETLNLFGAALFVFAGFFGYFSKMAIKEHGFGLVLNGLIGVAGICVALHFAVPRLPLLSGVSDEMRFGLGLIIAFAGAALLLVIAALFKNVATRQVNRVLIRVGTPPRPLPFQREPELDSRVAAAMRKKV